MLQHEKFESILEGVEQNISQIVEPQLINAALEDVKAQQLKLSSLERKSLIVKLIDLLDLTTLSGDDTPDRIIKLVEKAVNPLRHKDLGDEHSTKSRWQESTTGIFQTFDNEVLISGEHCAAVCVYPARIRDAVDHLNKLAVSGVKVASVAGGFPSGQYKLQTRLLEIQYAIEDGADEIDTVINRCAALTGNWQIVKDELTHMKELCGEKITLKTILAVGELGSLENIYKASVIAMEAGSNFIKTSTGKETVNATLPFSWVMCHAIKNFHMKTGRKVGFKPAGGVKTTEEAMGYFLLVESILGEEWMNPELFRIGASSLLDDLVKQYEILSSNLS